MSCTFTLLLSEVSVFSVVPYVAPVRYVVQVFIITITVIIIVPNSVMEEHCNG
jgi:hypothetical protein